MKGLRHALSAVLLALPGVAGAHGPAAATPDSPATAAFAGARFTEVEGADGVPLNVVDKGDPALPAVLLIHGFRQSYLSWTLQFGADLSTRCRLVAFDLRGHGNSGHPWRKEAYDNARPWADDVARVIAALKLQKPLVVGWSFGGQVAMDFATLHPEVPVAGFLLTGTAGGTAAAAAPPPNPNPQPGPTQLPDLLRNIDAVEASTRLLFGTTPLHPALRAQFNAAAMRVGPWVDRAVAGRARSDRVDVHAPVTFANGGRDPLVVAATRTRLKDFFPRASFVDFPTAGHAVFLDEPQAFNDLIDRLQCRPPGS